MTCFESAMVTDDWEVEEDAQFEKKKKSKNQGGIREQQNTKLNIYKKKDSSNYSEKKSIRGYYQGSLKESVRKKPIEIISFSKDIQ